MLTSFFLRFLVSLLAIVTCRIVSVSLLHTGLTRPPSMWNVKKVDLTLKRQSWRRIRVHLSTRSALELRLKIKTRLLSSTKLLTPCSDRLLITSSAPHRLVEIHGRSCLVTRGRWSPIATMKGLM